MLRRLTLLCGPLCLLLNLPVAQARERCTETLLGWTPTATAAVVHRICNPGPVSSVDLHVLQTGKRQTLRRDYPDLSGARRLTVVKNLHLTGSVARIHGVKAQVGRLGRALIFVLKRRAQSITLGRQLVKGATKTRVLSLFWGPGYRAAAIRVRVSWTTGRREVRVGVFRVKREFVERAILARVPLCDGYVRETRCVIARLPAKLRKARTQALVGTLNRLVGSAARARTAAARSRLTRLCRRSAASVRQAYRLRSAFRSCFRPIRAAP